MSARPLKITCCRLIFALVLAMAQSLGALPAYAQCVEGQPCIVPFTPNDPFVLPISPNVPPAPNASKNNSDVCDADFMNQIYGNAFLEAQRETISAEAIMLKPDSVLEYTCFDQLASRNARYAPLSFSWPTGGLPPLTELLVLQALKSYIDGNFWHSFLGGAAGLDTSIVSTVGSGAYVCPLMNDVFIIAKCSDFGLEAPFSTFEELINFEPRLLPRKCMTGTKITQELIDLANNKNWYYVSFDKIDPLLSKFRSGKTTCENDKPIPTGVMIQNLEKGVDILGRPVTIAGSDYTYEDKVCSNPGCSFDHKNNADGADDACIPR